MAGEKNSKYKPEYDELAYHIFSNGGTVRTLSIKIGISESTLYNWKSLFESFRNSISNGYKEFKASGLISKEVVDINESEEYKRRVELKRPVRRRSNSKAYSIPKRKVEACLRARLYHAVKGNVKRTSIKNLPYKTEDLMAHIESKFHHGMSWENYGDWHIDHIKPCSSFNQLDHGEFLECWSLENLQPLWARDNMLKGAKHG